MRECQECHQPTKNKTFCSLSCSRVSFTRAAQRQSKPRANCLVCGNPVKEYRAKFCSHSCSAKITNQNRANKNPMPRCPHCNTSMKSRQQEFCSKACRKDWRTKEWLSGNLIIETEHTPKIIRHWIIGLRGSVCWKCGWAEENPSTGNVPVELDHIDGNYKNNSVDNLQLLCPNCHSLTPNYRGLNMGNGRGNRRLAAVETRKKVTLAQSVS